MIEYDVLTVINLVILATGYGVSLFGSGALISV